MTAPALFSAQAGRKPARRDCHGRLVHALLEMAGPGSDIMEARLVPWCSATFIGARHEAILRLRGPAAATRAKALAAGLPDAEFRIPGHIVADLAVDTLTLVSADEARLSLSILSIEAW